MACVLAAAACGAKKQAPEADPALAKELAAKLQKHMPAPSAVRECTPQDLIGGTSMTFLSLLRLAGTEVPTDNIFKDWINPAELDAPAVRTLLDDKADTTAKRRAAAALAAAKFYVVHRVDVVNAPIALEIKDLKRGTIHARVMRFERTGLATCVSQVEFQNDEKKSDWAISVSTKNLIDPEVAKLMQDDLRDQYLKVAPGQPPKPKK